MGTEHFYRELPSFSEFSGILDGGHFQKIPNDWSVIITDVKGSTQAIESGRYKDVNLVGAAAIACMQNVVGDEQLPFVFGGDGATFLVPPLHFESIVEELVALKEHAKNSFGLMLRVGAVSVAEIEQEGSIVEVAKFELIAGQAVAILRGGGVTAAEDKVKNSPDNYEINRTTDRKVDLKGLSCRWQPIPSRNGKILSLLVVAQPDNGNAYREVLDSLDSIYGGNMETANPIALEKMGYRTVRECLRDERRYHTSRFSLRYTLRVLEILFSVLVFRLKMPAMLFSAKQYKASIPKHSDYRKFDDALRMIIDCSDKQCTEIHSTLKTLHQEKSIFYGLHESPTSLMTCYVGGVADGQHIHFVDGGNGGYAMAAKGLKAQIKAAR